MQNLDLNLVPTPCFVLDLEKLRDNLRILASVKKRCGARILLAQKAFAMFSVYPLLRTVLDGVCASSPYEARLGREEFGREVHSFAAAFSETDLKTILQLSDCVVFNSFSQWRRFRELCRQYEKRVSFGLRVNPEHSEAVAEIYSPCARGSRLGIRKDAFAGESLEGITGLHFHTLCQQNADALERTLEAFEERFAPWIPEMKWLNFGGGHHITRADYDLDKLCNLVNAWKARYSINTIYLEPGEAVALNAGSLVATVLDVVENDGPIAILDTSAAAHMPDVLEMPYRPEVSGAGKPGELGWDCRLAGLSCLAGDVIGGYSFAEPLRPGDRIELLDMAIYSMVKTNTFNGLALPSIATWDSTTNQFQLIRQFTYEDFKNRLS
ncbi:MAG: carboxynorspermidine decarboxylase [Lentisphaerae bacterium]|jgi:carboxynorspermidine decarboxylase|nr:carboxynorspermidine decarboxylase [Lentisphaerota bacterium]